MSPEQAANVTNDGGTGRRTEDTSVATFRLDDDFAQSQHATIMMIDDEPIMMGVVQAFLEVTGYRKLTKIEHSAEAVEKVRELRPDVLLLAVTMSGVSGFDILETLRADTDFTDLPIIILTSSANTAIRLQALDLGANDFLSKPVDPVELALRVRNTLEAKGYRYQLAHFDRLTGLPDRHLFRDRVDWAIARAQRERSKLALLHVSFEDFKRFNDSFGPEVGDDILKQLVKRLVSKLRASDVVNRDAAEDDAQTNVFRLGRAEFSVLLPSIESIAGAAVVGQRILAAMSEPLNADGSEVSLKPSIGISGFPDDSDEAATLVQLSIAASSQAIAQGGGRLQFYSSAMNEASQQWLRMERDLRRAVDGEELRLLYQPKVNVSNGTVVGAEALLRWPRPDGIFVSPSDFISVAEETHMILPIGEWALREACRQAVQWREQGVNIKIAVNISAPQFFDTKLAPLVQSILEETGLGPGMLTLEITESIVIDRLRQALTILGDLRAIGVEISIDDFGTGYSSLGYLKRIEVDEVKIDKTLIADVVTSPKDRALAYAVTYLAHQFGFRVCAEGVEDVNQLNIVRKINCDQYQGYLINRPLDPQTFVDQYRERQSESPLDGR